MQKKDWKEFQESGLLWWINMILHTFGWAIVLETEDDGSISAAYPARVLYHGFSDLANDEGYTKVEGTIIAHAADLKRRSQL